jgi:hypothetical protein
MTQYWGPRKWERRGWENLGRRREIRPDKKK